MKSDRAGAQIGKLGSPIVSTVPGWADPRRWAPVLVGLLAVANLAAGWFVWRTPGGSSDTIEAEAAQARAQVQRAASNLNRVRALVKKVETARADQDRFVARYFMDRRTASSTILSELGASAFQAGLAPREHSFTFDPVEGSDVFSMMTIAANYEGRYTDLRKFINTLDRSSRFLIIEDVTAVPQQEAGKLTARFRINAFVREGGGPAPAAAASGATAAPASAAPTGNAPLRPKGPRLVAPKSTGKQLPKAPASAPAAQLLPSAGPDASLKLAALAPVRAAEKRQ